MSSAELDEGNPIIEFTLSHMTQNPPEHHVIIVEEIISFLVNLPIKRSMVNFARRNRDRPLYEVYGCNMVEHVMRFTAEYVRGRNRRRNLVPLLIHNYFAIAIIEEICEWFQYQSRSVNAILSENDFPVNHIDLLEWNVRGKINYRDSAVKILAKPEFAPKTKFLIASSHSLEEEMLALIPQINSEEIKNLPQFIQDQELREVLMYWIYQIMNHTCPELEINVRKYEIRRKVGLRRINPALIKEYSIECISNPILLFYNWRMLPVTEKLYKFMIDWEVHRKAQYLELLMGLDDNDRLVFFTQEYFMVILVFVHDFLYGELLLLVLNNLKRYLEPDEFWRMLENILDSIIYFGSRGDSIYTEHKLERYVIMINILWGRTTEECKKLVVQKREYIREMLRPVAHRSLYNHLLGMMQLTGLFQSFEIN